MVMAGRTALALFCCGAMACGGGGPTEIPERGDPNIGDQWYLHGQENNQDVVSINLQKKPAYEGRGVLVAIVDNGLDLEHEDLASNVDLGNFSYLPATYGFSNADHGTAVAGIIGAAKNGVGGVGIAPSTRLVAYNALRAPSTENLADALIRGIERVAISNNSWGDFNSWGEPLHLKGPIEDALRKGTSEGRHGLGIVYVFSAGNGAVIDQYGVPSDNVNYSGLVNNKFTLPICAVDQFGKKTRYSEAGATLLVCAPSKGSDKQFGIFTTDVTGNLGYNRSAVEDEVAHLSYTRQFGGTSAAAPMVSGVVALMLEANPSLGWRDVRYILASTAQRNDFADPEWSLNGAGFHINHNYGFGLVDASAALDAAERWVNLPASLETEGASIVEKIIPDGLQQGLESEVHIIDSLIVEFIDVVFDAPDHPRIGDLTITLTSPSGTTSILSERHNQLFGLFRYADWRFGTVRHLGERSDGKWQLKVQDLRSGESGKWKKWRLRVHGHVRSHAPSGD